MARAGGGGRSGGGRAGGGRSSFRSAGGHRMSGRAGSSRPGAGFGNSGGSGFGSMGSSFGYGSSMGRRRTSVPVFRTTTPVYTGGRNQTVPMTGCGTALGTVLVIVALFVILALVLGGTSGGGEKVPASTVNRERAETGLDFSNDCITDELGWFDSPAVTAGKLRGFFDETGVQPYIYLRRYDPNLTDDAQKLEFAHKWYDEHIGNEGTFLYVYFAEADQDGDVGYMCYVAGRQVTTVMDPEAVEIFWAYLDSSWYSDRSTDQVFLAAFNDTADRIMERTTTGADVALWVVIFLGAGGILLLVLYLMKVRRQQQKEANEEAERILKTPLEDLDDTDELADKYTKTDQSNIKEY